MLSVHLSYTEIHGTWKSFEYTLSFLYTRCVYNSFNMFIIFCMWLMVSITCDYEKKSMLSYRMFMMNSWFRFFETVEIWEGTKQKQLSPNRKNGDTFNFETFKSCWCAKTNLCRIRYEIHCVPLLSMDSKYVDPVNM